MNKKIVTLLIAAAMTAAPLTACGEDKDTGLSSETGLTIEIATEETDEQETTASEAEKQEEPTDNTEEATEEQTTEAAQDATEDIQQQSQAQEPSANAEPATEAPTQAPTAAPTAAPTQAPTEAPTEAPAGSFEHDDMTFVCGNTYATVLVEASGLISALGTPQSVEEAPSCLSNGKDVKIYYFSGVTVYTYVDGDMDIIYEIELTDSTHSTPKGLKVGMTLADAQRIYGMDYEYSGGVVSYYDSATTYMYLYMSGDTIASIGYAAEV